MGSCRHRAPIDQIAQGGRGNGRWVLGEFVLLRGSLWRWDMMRERDNAVRDGRADAEGLRERFMNSPSIFTDECFRPCRRCEGCGERMTAAGRRAAISCGRDRAMEHRAHLVRNAGHHEDPARCDGPAVVDSGGGAGACFRSFARRRESWPGRGCCRTSARRRMRNIASIRASHWAFISSG